MIDVPSRAVVIGASAGAVDALSQILPALPADYPLPILVVIHVPPDRSNMLASLFRAKCRMAVREAEDKEPVTRGVIYFAPSDYHLLVESAATLALSNDEPVLYSRPSIDVLFETAADSWGAGVTGIILTGANPDGAKGLKAVADAGGIALVEEPSTAYADVMPIAALKACPVARAMPLASIAEHLLAECQG